MTGDNALPNESPSLMVFDGESLVFASSGRWLHPLFELERHLRSSGIEAAPLRVEDKIIGKAAAFLIVRLGFRRAHGVRLSRLGEGVFRSYGVAYTYGELVDRIDCATEAMLEEVDDVDEAYRLVKARASGETPRISQT